MCVSVCVCVCVCVCVWVRYRAVRGGGGALLSGGGAAAPPAGQTEGNAADCRSHTHTPGAEPAAETPAEPGQTGNTHTHTQADPGSIEDGSSPVRVSVYQVLGSQHSFHVFVLCSILRVAQTLRLLTLLTATRGAAVVAGAILSTLCGETQNEKNKNLALLCNKVFSALIRKC